MVKHVIIWALKDDIADKKELMKKIKVELEGLVGKIEGLLEMKIIIEGLASCKGDFMLDSTFTDEAALKYYSSHPDHVAIADGLVRPNVSARLAYDYEI